MWMQLCGSLSILWHCLSLGLEWKLRNEITRGLSVDGTVLNESWAKKAACFHLTTFSCRRTSARGQSWFDQQVRWPCPRYSEAGEKRRWSQSKGREAAAGSVVRKKPRQPPASFSRNSPGPSPVLHVGPHDGCATCVCQFPEHWESLLCSLPTFVDQGGFNLSGDILVSYPSFIASKSISFSNFCRSRRQLTAILPVKIESILILPNNIIDKIQNFCSFSILSSSPSFSREINYINQFTLFGHRTLLQTSEEEHGNDCYKWRLSWCK